MKRTIPATLDLAVKEQKSFLTELAKKIHRSPELGFEEKKACAWQVARLRRWRFKVEVPFSGMPTAFKAVYGRGRPAFCIMSEYDALPGIGHACGHNLIASAALGAGYALSRVIREEKIKGSLVIIGAPAEESKGGKVRLVEQGGLKGIDTVLMAHPSFRTTIDTGCTAIQRFLVTFKGKSAHAAAAPEKARNALDAVMLLFQGVNAWRQQLPESSRVHGIVTNGGVAPNVIPDVGACVFFLRSPRDSVVNSMVKHFKDIARGAALMTDTRLTISPWLVPYKARWPNRSLNTAYIDAVKERGLKVVLPEHPGRGSSDFGDVSQVVPGAHVYFGISDKREIAGHSVDFRNAAKSPYAMKSMIKAAAALATVGYRFMTEPLFRAEVKKDFELDKMSRRQ